MTNKIMVIPIGTKVTTKVGGINGIISAFFVRENSVMYNVNYANGGDIKLAELYEFEFEKSDAKKTEIGFK